MRNLITLELNIHHDHRIIQGGGWNTMKRICQLKMAPILHQLIHPKVPYLKKMKPTNPIMPIIYLPGDIFSENYPKCVGCKLPLRPNVFMFHGTDSNPRVDSFTWLFLDNDWITSNNLEEIFLGHWLPTLKTLANQQKVDSEETAWTEVKWNRPTWQ